MFHSLEAVNTVEASEVSKALGILVAEFRKSGKSSWKIGLADYAGNGQVEISCMIFDRDGSHVSMSRKL